MSLGDIGSRQMVRKLRKISGWERIGSGDPGLSWRPCGGLDLGKHLGSDSGAESTRHKELGVEANFRLGRSAYISHQ